ATKIFLLTTNSPSQLRLCNAEEPIGWLTRKSRRTPMDPSQERLSQIDAHFRAANYIGAAQLYLRDNALLREPLKPENIKARLLVHWGTQPGLNLVYAHLNRLIQDTAANILLVVGTGHGAPAILADLYLE